MNKHQKQKYEQYWGEIIKLSDVPQVKVTSFVGNQRLHFKYGKLHYTALVNNDGKEYNGIILLYTGLDGHIRRLDTLRHQTIAEVLEALKKPLVDDLEVSQDDTQV